MEYGDVLNDMAYREQLLTILTSTSFKTIVRNQ